MAYPRAELVQRAITAYLQQHKNSSSDVFGLWKQKHQAVKALCLINLRSMKHLVDNHLTVFLNELKYANGVLSIESGGPGIEKPMPNIPKTITYNLAKILSSSLSILDEKSIESIARKLARQKGNKNINNLASFCTDFDREFHGIENKILLNGESWLIDKLAGLHFKVIFDVGANVGNWSRLAYQSHPASTIHSFEIVATTFDILKKNLSTIDERIVLNAFGLSDSDGTIPVFIDNENNVLSSTLDFHNNNLTKLDCQIKTGETYLSDNNILNIDFLKIDVEGGEHRVLKGFENLLKNQQIRIIQFEYNQGAIISKFLLRDFYLYFEKFGYQLGKLFPEGVLFKDYQLHDEDFKGPNYIAIKRNDDELFKLISFPS